MRFSSAGDWSSVRDNKISNLARCTRGSGGAKYRQENEWRISSRMIAGLLRTTVFFAKKSGHGPRRSPKLVFVNSMSDLFHSRVPDDYVEAVSRVMAIADWHTYQVLTKRSERLCGLLNGKLRFAADRENIWWGVSVEDRKHGLPRVAHLQQARAKMRFLSIEPLLEDLGEIDLSGIDWVIVGGESGPGDRPMKREWVLSIREQCRDYGIPFFFKQWGGVRKAKAGRELDGRTYDEYPRRNPPQMPDKQKRATFAEPFFQSFRQLFCNDKALVQVTS